MASRSSVWLHPVRRLFTVVHPVRALFTPECKDGRMGKRPQGLADAQCSTPFTERKPFWKGCFISLISET
jgi:hypothetical protein